MGEVGKALVEVSEFIVTMNCSLSANYPLILLRDSGMIKSGRSRGERFRVEKIREGEGQGWVWRRKVKSSGKGCGRVQLIDILACYSVRRSLLPIPVTNTR